MTDVVHCRIIFNLQEASHTSTPLSLCTCIIHQTATPAEPSQARPARALGHTVGLVVGLPLALTRLLGIQRLLDVNVRRPALPIQRTRCP